MQILICTCNCMQAICGMIKSMADPIFAEYTGKYCIQSLEFESLSLGTFPPIIQGFTILHNSALMIITIKVVFQLKQRSFLHDQPSFWFFLNMVGVKIHETNEKELVIEPAIRWAGNPSISVVLRTLSIPVTIQVRSAFRFHLDFSFIRILRIVLH